MFVHGQILYFVTRHFHIIPSQYVFRLCRLFLIIRMNTLEVKNIKHIWVLLFFSINISLSCVDFYETHNVFRYIIMCLYYVRLYIVYIKSIGGFPPVLFPTLKNRTSPNYFQWKLIRKSFTFYTKLFLVLVWFNSECAHAIERVRWNFIIPYLFNDKND